MPKRFRQAVLAVSIVFNSGAIFSIAGAAEPASIRVVVWDEQQPQQKQAYDNFLGNEIAGHLKKLPGVSVRTSRLDDAEHGAPDELIDNCDVLIWWGHVRNREVPLAQGERIARRIVDGKLSLIALHSAHWSSPFIAAMNERAKRDALAKLTPDERKDAKVELVPAKLYTPPAADARLSPSATYRKPPGGPVQVTIQLPNCCFPAYRTDGKPGHVRTLLTDHPIAAGLPKEFTLSATEMYCEPFHVPEPDAVVFDERWDSGDWFRSGSLWHVGKGQVFYFRPGHETYPIYKDANVLKILENAVRFLAHKD